MEGLDISHHQTTTPDLTGIDFVICRATYGVTPDRKYAEHAANVRAAGKVLGAYHFARPTSTGESVEAQVTAFLTAAPDADLYAIDREADGTNGIITLADTRKFIALVQQTGRRIGLYSSQSAFRSLGQDWAWVARWGAEPTIPYDIWQYDGSGTDRLDNDSFEGTLGALIALGAPLKAWVEREINEANTQIADLEQQVTAATTANEALTNQLEDTQAALDEKTVELQITEGKLTVLQNDVRVAANSIKEILEFGEQYAEP